jgi:predicted nucleic acid-binding protein
LNTFYLDTSALAKRYLSEQGSSWITALVHPTAGNIIVVCDLTAVEFFSSLARRQREGTITPADALKLQKQFLTEFERQYLSVGLEEAVLSHARNLVSRHPLRSLDAIQLASAHEAISILEAPMTFVSADKNLLAIAASEGFATDNPNEHA